MKKKTLVYIAGILVFMLAIAGCSNKKNEANATPKEVRIGTIRVPNDKQVAIQKKYFESFFNEKNIKVKYIFFDSGVAANQALASGSVDFAEMGYTNGIVAEASNIPVELIWIHEVLGENEALVSKKNYTSIEELEGKKIATPFSSTSHYSLLSALKEAGLENKVTLLDMQTSDIVAAWERGDIDAAYTWEPTLSQLKKNGNVLIDSKMMAEKGYPTTNIDLVRSDFAKKYPELVEGYLRALNKAVELYNADPNEAAKAASSKLGISETEALNQMQATTWLSLDEQLQSDYFGNRDGRFYQVFENTAQFLYNQGSIQQVPSKKAVQQFIQPKYIEAALKEEQDNE